MLASFKANLDARPGATESLRIWCERQAIARPAAIVANMVSNGASEPPPGIRGLLRVSESEPLAYRHVELTCGNIVLSKAHNWYVPARLTDDMNRQLRETDTPFGKVVSGLGFRRQTLASNGKVDAACPAGTIFANRGLLSLPDGAGLAMVIECYTKANLEPPAQIRRDSGSAIPNKP